MEIKLGQKVRDSVSGFEGIAECRTEWRFGCIRIGIRPQKLDENGMPMEIMSFDEPQVEVIGDTPDRIAKKAGGPRQAPNRGR